MQRFYKNCGRFVRHRSVSHLISEMRTIASNYFVDFFEFWDENFELDPFWLMDFCETYAEQVNFPFIIGLRPEKATPSLLTLLKRANCWVICMGVETGDERYRREVLNKKATNDQIISAFREARRLGIVMSRTNSTAPVILSVSLSFIGKLNSSSHSTGVPGSPGTISRSGFPDCRHRIVGHISQGVSRLW